MGGVSVESGQGKRRSVDSDINMIPMIDLLMVTISFLLITAVWTKMSRVEASAKVPGDVVAPPCEGQSCDPPPELHVDMRQPDHFSLSWREKGTVVRTRDVMRQPARERMTPVKAARPSVVRFPELQDAIVAEYNGSATAPNARPPRAVLHAANDAHYDEMVAAMDAIYAARRPDKGAAPAFVVTLSTD